MEEDGQVPSIVEEQQRNMQVDNAIRAIREKKPVPEIDFTIHSMEDGSQVNTQERVCKGTYLLPIPPTPLCPTTYTHCYPAAASASRRITALLLHTIPLHALSAYCM